MGNKKKNTFNVQEQLVKSLKKKILVILENQKNLNNINFLLKFNHKVQLKLSERNHLLENTSYISTKPTTNICTSYCKCSCSTTMSYSICTSFLSCGTNTIITIILILL